MANPCRREHKSPATGRSPHLESDLYYALARGYDDFAAFPSHAKVRSSA